MTSITVSTREDDQDSHPKATLLDVSNGNSLCHSSDSGIHAPACSKPCDNDMVTVTHCRVAGGSLSSDEQDCALGENAEHHDNDDDDDDDESPSDQGSPKEVGVIDSEQG